MSVEGQIDGSQNIISDAQQALDGFWSKTTDDIRALTPVSF